ncbi:MAG: hypothetical protein WC410_00255 [Candidatus Paceibacterota bacterium]|jgi:hypothetical protein
MDYETKSIIPNTTQIPHLIIREWMPRLSDVELRILLVVADQTLGWIEDPETKRRKEKDWISQYQLMTKINRSDRAIQKALKRLVDELAIIQAHDEFDNLLDSSQKRMKCGGKIFYRLSLRPPQPELFSFAPEKCSGGRKQFPQPPKILRAKNFRATKETGSTKFLAKASELALRNKKWAEDPKNNPDGAVSSTFVLRTFGKYMHAFRGNDFRIAYERGKDGRLAKRAVRHLSFFQIEMLFVWFAKEKTQIKPAVAVALCKKVISEFINESHRREGFYGELEAEALRISGRKKFEVSGQISSMHDALKRLKDSFEMTHI